MVRNYLIWICWALLLSDLLIAGCGGESPTRDRESPLTGRLVGLWRYSRVFRDTTYVSLMRFESDGRFDLEVHVGDEAGEVVFWSRGYYFVSEEMLYLLIETSSDPSQVGGVREYEIILKGGEIYLVYVGSLDFIWEKVESA